METSIKQTNMHQQNIVPVNAVKVKSIKAVGKANVYNMEVLKHHSFAINGGLIVHNCLDGDRYFIRTILFASTAYYSDQNAW